MDISELYFANGDEWPLTLVWSKFRTSPQKRNRLDDGLNHLSHLLIGYNFEFLENLATSNHFCQISESGTLQHSVFKLYDCIFLKSISFTKKFRPDLKEHWRSVAKSNKKEFIVRYLVGGSTQYTRKSIYLHEMKLIPMLHKNFICLNASEQFFKMRFALKRLKFKPAIATKFSRTWNLFESCIVLFCHDNRFYKRKWKTCLKSQQSKWI